MLSFFDDDLMRALWLRMIVIVLISRHYSTVNVNIYSGYLCLLQE